MIPHRPVIALAVKGRGDDCDQNPRRHFATVEGKEGRVEETSSMKCDLVEFKFCIEFIIKILNGRKILAMRSMVYITPAG